MLGETPDYDAFLLHVKAKDAALAGPVFSTDADGLYDLYLDSFPLEDRQHYTCHACRRFIQGFGHVVTLDEAGNATPVVWNAKGQFAALHRAVAGPGAQLEGRDGGGEAPVPQGLHQAGGGAPVQAVQPRRQGAGVQVGDDADPELGHGWRR